ncbi:MAG: hypothetical protein Q9160_004502 [Pyrenula sp. 1 TL-2023]
MVGFATLLEALESGYRTRVVVNQREDLEAIRGHHLIRPYTNSVEFVGIPDPLVVGAYDSAVQGADYIIHLASSIPDSAADEVEVDADQEYLDPAVEGAVGILRSAMNSPTVRRVVSLSSLLVLEPAPPGSITGPYDLASPPSHPMDSRTIYRAARILSHLASTRFMTTANPPAQFSFVQLLPAYVIGRNELASNSSEVRAGSNDVLIDLVTASSRSTPPTPRSSTVVHVNDVARAHVLALSPHLTIPSGSSFILAANQGVSIDWDFARDIVWETFPEAVQNGLLRLERNQPSMRTGMYDVSETERVLGLDFRSFEEAVRSVIGQYVELLEHEMEG